MPDPISWSFTGPYLASALLLGYLFGSIPFGLILTRLAGVSDIRTMGSGNVGATNVLRHGGKLLAMWTLILDMLKGSIPVLLAREYGPDMAIMAGAGAFFGHLYPVWLKFRGGKGVATGLGVLLSLSWPAGIFACSTWIVIAVIFRFSSLASLTAFATAPIYVWVFSDQQRLEFTLFLSFFILLRHMGNIVRLAQGRESRLNI